MSDIMRSSPQTYAFHKATTKFAENLKEIGPFVEFLELEVPLSKECSAMLLLEARKQPIVYMAITYRAGCPVSFRFTCEEEPTLGTYLNSRNWYVMDIEVADVFKELCSKLVVAVAKEQTRLEGLHYIAPLL